MRFAPATFAPRRAKRRRYLRIVDKFNDQNVFAYVTAGQVEFRAGTKRFREQFREKRRKETSTRAHDSSKHEPKRLRFDRDREGLTFRWTGPTQVKFLLLHEGRNEDAVRNFFLEVHELYVKLVMNPFYEHDTPITSPTFDRAVHALARRHL